MGGDDGRGSPLLVVRSGEIPDETREPAGEDTDAGGGGEDERFVVAVEIDPEGAQDERRLRGDREHAQHVRAGKPVLPGQVDQ